MNWLTIRELIRKEFIQLFRDKKNRPILIVAPLIQLLIFGYVVNYDVKDVRVAIFDQSQTSESRMVADAIRGNGIFLITNYVASPGELEKLLLAGKVDLAVTVPPDFSRLIRQGQTAAIQILADGSMSNVASLRLAYLSTIIEGLNGKFLRELYPQRMDYGRIDGRIRTWFNPNLDSQYFFVPAVVAFLIMLLSLLLTSMAIIKEKEAGTMEQLIVTPLLPVELIIGKTVPYIIISLAQMIVVTIFAIFWFSLPLAGSVGLLFVASCLFLLSTLGVGLFISTISSTQQQAMMTTFFFLLPFFMLSGFVFPIANMPLVVQMLTYLNPLRYFLVIIRGIFLKGVGLAILWEQFAAMTVIGVVLFATAIWRFRKRLD
jgi:ABC-2 type transport system permease protein